MGHDEITIVAGGWSASGYDLSRLPGFVIAVNDAAYYLPRFDVAVSMDRLWAENRFEWLKRKGKQVYLRRSTIKNFSIIDQPLFVGFECDHETSYLTDREGWLNGKHSGGCALNLAYQMRPKKCWLVGFDLQNGPRGEKHWYPDYPWKAGGGSKTGTLQGWLSEFGQQRAQMRRVGIDVRVCKQTTERPKQKVG